MSKEGTRIIFYGTRWCSDCYRARKIMDGRNIPYNWVDIDQDAEGRAFVEKVNQGYRRVPTIVWPDGSVLVEPSNAALTQKLDTSLPK